MTEQLNRPLALEDVNTMMKPLETDVPASRNRLRDHHEKFENVSKEIKVTQTCEIAGFMRTVSPGQCFKAIYDIDDGVEEKLEHAESIHYTVTMMILSQWGGSVDAVFQFKVTYYAEQYGIEIQVKFMLNNGSLSWIS